VCCAEFMHHPPAWCPQFTQCLLQDAGRMQCRGTYIACNVAGHSTEAHAQTRQGHGIPKPILIHELLVEHNQGGRYGHVHEAGHHCSNLLCQRMQIPAIPNQRCASGMSMFAAVAGGTHCRDGSHHVEEACHALLCVTCCGFSATGQGTLMQSQSACLGSAVATLSYPLSLSLS